VDAAAPRQPTAFSAQENPMPPAPSKFAKSLASTRPGQPECRVSACNAAASEDATHTARGSWCTKALPKWQNGHVPVSLPTTAVIYCHSAAQVSLQLKKLI
jgi:hypothetical protein